MLVRQADELMLQLRELQPTAPYIQEVIVSFGFQPSAANGPISRLAGRARDIPALHHLCTIAPRWSGLVPLQPGILDEVSLERDRPLQILRRKCERTHLAFNLFKQRRWFARRMQDFPLPATMDCVGPGRYLLLVLSDRWQAQMVPTILRQ